MGSELRVKAAHDGGFVAHPRKGREGMGHPRKPLRGLSDPGCSTARALEVDEITNPTDSKPCHTTGHGPHVLRKGS